MAKWSALPLIAATIVLNLTLAFALRNGLIACGAGEAIAGWIASSVWSVVALSTLTFAARRWNRRYVDGVSVPSRVPGPPARRS